MFRSCNDYDSRGYASRIYRDGDCAGIYHLQHSGNGLQLHSFFDSGRLDRHNGYHAVHRLISFFGD